jgi:hypothetical protein
MTRDKYFTWGLADTWLGSSLSPATTNTKKKNGAKEGEMALQQ